MSKLKFAERFGWRRSVLAPTVDDAVGATLRTFCEAADWSVGQVWLPDAAGEVLFCGPVWYQKGPGLEAFRQASEAITFGPGESFFGCRVVGRAEPMV